ncbi:ATP-binding protein [Cytobacillus praedii]|uniref:ATP-binding protein n=1 Tax=Cytobacillus praedii TaxID=1742358 RepID=UPI000709225D|nr:AAA family ATPase [Cytobacillus praedii]
MKITDLHIYGYGKLSGLKIADLNEFQVFYGENEAGKSTIMSFIHSILFGFPTKQQSELRYEPKDGSKYGGQLTAIFPAHGKAVIERVKGKSAGDVRVTLEDGTLGEEELLKELLSNVDKALYQSIFSFNVHGLQNIHQLKGEDLGRFLFSAGTLGTDQLIQAENLLLKELDSRFKPNGKKPTINIKLNELKQVHQELKRAEKQNEQYWTFLKERVELEEQITSNHEELLLVQDKKARLEEWRHIQPLKMEEQLIEEELRTFEEIHFPIDGLTRMDRLEQMIKPLEGQLAGLVQRKNHLIVELENSKPNEAFIHKEPEITAAVESLPLLEKLNQEKEELTVKLQELTQAELTLKEKLHLPIQEDELLSINTSVFMKEKITHTEEQYRRVKAKKHDLDERFNEGRQLLEETEEKMKILEQQRLPVSVRLELEKKIKDTNQREIIEYERTQIDDRLAFLQLAEKKEMEKTRRKKAQDRIQLTLFSILFMILVVLGIVNAEWLLVIAGVLGMIVTLYLHYKKITKSNGDFFTDEMKTLKEKKRELIQKLNEHDDQEMSAIKIKLENDREIVEQLRHYQLLWEQGNEQYERIIAAFESWEKAKLEAERRMIELGEELFLPRDIALNYLGDAFQLIEQLKKLYRERKNIFERSETVSMRITEMIEGISSLSDAYLKMAPSTIQETAYLLRKLLKDETEKQIKQSEKQTKFSELEEEYVRKKIEHDHFLMEQQKLLQLAQAENIENFREIGQWAEKKRQLNDKLKNVVSQLKRSSFNEEEIETYMSVTNIDSIIQKHTVRMKELKENMPILQQSLAEIKYEIQVIEEGGTYADLLHKFKQMKAELEEDAKEWAKYAIAKEILDKTVERFKTERMPRMLKKAEEFLTCLTNGKYVRLYLKKDSSGFLIESSNQQLFEANEVSQATMEQIYVAFRLSLALTIYEKLPFPIIIDDSFVNFDHVRTEKIMSLLKGIENRQILFFTCHKHMLPYFSQNQILNVNHTASLLV